MLSSLLASEGVLCSIKGSTKKQVLAELSESMATLTKIDSHIIHETLLQRERLGSTGIGQGIAIPHGQIEGIEKMIGGFVRLPRAIDFEAPDGVMVDLIFVLLGPKDAGADHLRALAKVARLFRDPIKVQKLRITDDPEALYALLTSDSSSSEAA